MRELIGMARNIALSCLDDGDDKTLVPMIEMVLITSEPQFEVDVSGLVKRRTTQTIRLAASPKCARWLAESLVEWADAADKLAERLKQAEEPDDD